MGFMRTTLMALALCAAVGLTACSRGNGGEDDAMTEPSTPREQTPKQTPSQATFERDTVTTSMGELTMTFIGHGTLMFEIDGKVIHIDPVSREADYSTLPKGDLILITHEHRDHLDPDTIAAARKRNAPVVATKAIAKDLPNAAGMANGEKQTVGGIAVEAVPAYNLEHTRDNGEPFHPKGRDNGYVLTFGDTRVYVAGDTENTPELKALEDIDIAFLPMNLPYTMTPEMAADAAKAMQPKVVYPYHFGDTDPQKLVDLLKDEEGIEVRIRDLA